MAGSGGQQRLGDDWFGELGEQDHERTATKRVPSPRRTRRGSRFRRAGRRGRTSRRRCAGAVSRHRRWHDRSDLPAEGEQAGAISQTRRDRRHHHHRVHRVLQSRHPIDLPGHHATAVEEQEHGLVPLGAIGADDELGGARGGGPVDAAELVVGRELAQLLELRSASAALRRPKPDFEDARPVDAQLGLVAALERREHAEHGRQGACAGARASPSGPSTRTVRSVISNRPRRAGRIDVVAVARPFAGTFTRTRRVSARKKGASWSASLTGSERDRGLATVHSTSAVAAEREHAGQAAFDGDVRRVCVPRLRARRARSRAGSRSTR